VSSQCRFRTPTRGNHAIAESADAKYDTEAADENVHLATETSSPDMLLDLSVLATLKVDQFLRELCCSMDDWHRVSGAVPDSASGLLGGFPWVRKQRYATQG